MNHTCELCHKGSAPAIALHFGRKVPISSTQSTDETDTDVTEVKLPSGATHQVTNQGQLEVSVCNMCYRKWKLARLLGAFGSCLGTLLIGCLVVGLLSWLAAIVIQRVSVDAVRSISGIAPLVVGVAFLGLLKAAVAPVGQAMGLGRDSLIISTRRAQLEEQGFDLFWT